MEFWIYENTIHRKVRIHRTECSFCNNGRGIHGGGKTQSGNWFGPFADLERAVKTAQQRRQPDTRECEICLVHKSSITPVKDNIIPNEFEDAWEWDGIEKLNCSLQLAWTPRGRVVLDQEGKLRFPKVSSVPGLYRFRTRHPDGRRTLYI